MTEEHERRAGALVDKVEAPLGVIGQIAFVTHDLERSMDHFARHLGIGPWFYEPRLTFVEASYMGEPTAMEIAVGIANNGTMQYELIQQLNQHPSIYREMLAANPGQETFNHACIWAEAYEAKLMEAEARGFVIVQSMISGLGAAAYLINPAIPQIAFEIVEANAMRNRLRANVAAAAVNWDGRDSMRRGFPVNSL